MYIDSSDLLWQQRKLVIDRSMKATISVGKFQVDCMEVLGSYVASGCDDVCNLLKFAESVAKHPSEKVLLKVLLNVLQRTHESLGDIPGFPTESRCGAISLGASPNLVRNSRSA